MQRHKSCLMTGNYYYNIYKKGHAKFLLGYKSRKYFDGDDWSWEVWPWFQELICKACIKRLLNTRHNREEIRKTLSSIEMPETAVLSWGKDFTPETWPLYPEQLN